MFSGNTQSILMPVRTSTIIVSFVIALLLNFLLSPLVRRLLRWRINPPVSAALVVVLLTCNSNAASLQPSETRQDWQDLEVIVLDSQGNPAKTVYYSYDQLLTLPTITVKTERDPNTNTPATYTGIYISDLFEAFGADASLDVIGANCLDKYKQYYDRDYIAKHRPILLLKFDDSLPDDWPHAEQGSTLGPYCVVHESFSPSETIYGYVEEPRSAPAVSSLELTSFTQSLGRFAAKGSANDPEVVKGLELLPQAKALAENKDVKEFYLGMSSEGRKSFRDMKSYRRRKRWV